MNIKYKLHDTVFVGLTFEESQKIAEETSAEYPKDELRLFVENTYIKKITKKSYVLSPSELLELKKKWCDEVFDKAIEISVDNCDGCPNAPASFDYIGIRKDKTDYINSITLD